MRKTYLLSAALVTALGCAPLTFAQTAGHAWHGHHGMAMGGHMYDKLNLTDTQRDSIKQLRQQSFAQMKPQMQALRQSRQAYESATPGTAAYQTAASNLAEAEADATRARVTNEANLRAQIYKLLTPTQQTQLANLRAQREARMQQWKQFQQENPLPSSAPTSPAQ
ncbi:MAG TPA: Spy/CpxP family protein refolding chaperone [Rhodanobacteraceae bacterium]|nr:Spy/CpxP family protein refolding chaperone [Rhodanobacteraceae bacterium]